MFRKCIILPIVVLLILLTTATAAFAAPAAPDVGEVAAELVPVSMFAGVNWTAVTTTVIGVIVLAAIWGWARKQQFEDIYPNVILMSLLYVSCFASVAGILVYFNVGSYVLQLTVVVVTALIGYTMTYGKRAGAFKGRVAPLNIPALATFLLGLVALIAGLSVGLESFIAAQKAAALAAAADLLGGADSAAANAVGLVLTPLFVYMGAVIQKYVTRDADAEETV